MVIEFKTVSVARRTVALARWFQWNLWNRKSVPRCLGCRFRIRLCNRDLCNKVLVNDWWAADSSRSSSSLFCSARWPQRRPGGEGAFLVTCR